MAGNSESPRIGVLEEMTIEEVCNFNPDVVVVPIGSTEPHGPHLPYATDTIRCRATAEAATMIANSQGVRVLCYPALPISLNVNFSGFPFALSLRVKTFMSVLRDLCEQIERHGIRKIMIVNSHGGNPDVIGAFLRDWSYRGIAGTAGAENRTFVCSVNLPFPQALEIVEHPSIHGGEDETLDIMAIRSELVRTDKLDYFASEQPAMKWLSSPNVKWVNPWHLYLPKSAYGKTKHVKAEKARQFFELNNKYLAEMLVQLAQTSWSDMFPYKKD